MDYLIDMYLRGYEVIGVNKAKIERAAKLRVAKQRYKEFLEEMDIKSVIEEFFRKGFDAELFLNDNTKKPLKNPLDTLRTKFDKGNYRYLLMRVPVVPQMDQLKRLAANRLPVAQTNPTQVPFNDPVAMNQFANQLRLQRHKPRPQRGKLGGKSKYLPKSMKPQSEKQKKQMIEWCEEKFKNEMSPDEVVEVRESEE